jgi:hypothetical protein
VIRARIPAALLGAAVFFSAPAGALELPDLETFRDPVDGRLDASRWLLDHKGALPVPILITEPAVGYGAGLGLLFFHRNPAATPVSDSAEGVRRFEPPDITGGAAFGTENGSKGGGIGHLGFSEGRRWRYAAGAAYGSLNLAWYGLPGLGEGPRSNGLDFNIEAKVAVADVRRRFGDTEWWAGLRYVGAKTQSQFALRTPAEIPQRQFDATTSGLGLVVEYDGRDNIFTPNSGVRAYFDSLRYAEALGSDQDFTKSRFALHGFHPLGKSVVLGLRGDLQAADGDVPFYAAPFIELRGIPAMRYQGDRTAVVEVEGRWDLDARWSLVGFAGAGRAAASSGSLGEAPTRVTKGAGLRYLLARALGLRVGLDVARGPEESAFYIVVGSYWR